MPENDDRKSRQDDDDKTTGSEWLARAKFQWSVRSGIASAIWIVVSAAVSGAWLVYAKHLDLQNEDRIQGAENKLKGDLAAFQQIQERDRKQLEMLPNALNMLRESKCDTDLTAMVLLEELRRFRSARSDADVGTVAERATLALLLSRQSAHLTYCSCDALQAIKDLTEKGTDKRIAELASQLAQRAAVAGGPCASNAIGRAAMVEAANNFAQRGYYVVFSNDVSCDAAEYEYRKVLAELRRRLKDFKPALLHIKQGVSQGQTYFVTAYGGDFTITEASELVNALAGMGEVHRDIYWTTKKAFRGEAACAPKN